MSDVKYLIQVDAAAAVTSIQKLDAAWDGLNKKGKETKEVAGEAATALGNLAKEFTIGALAARGIEGALGGLKNLFGSAVKGAIDEEASQHRLVTALEMTGRARQGGIRDLLNFAEGQAKVTVYTHEQIEATATMLAQLTKLDRDGIKATTKGIIGLASVMGPDEGGLEGATRMVVRALEGNMQGLRRVGISIDETLPKGQQLIEL